MESTRLKHWILDEHGEPVETDWLTWARWLETDARILARDRDESGQRDILVSTVFLGIDHGVGDGPPILWETMVLGGGGQTHYSARYTSRADAIAGHRRACELANQGAFD